MHKEIPISHESAAALLAWLANGTLDAASAQAVQTHLALCPECQRELEAQTRLCNAMRHDGTDSVLFAAEASFHKLLGRLDAEPAVAPSSAGLRNRLRRASFSPVRWLSAAAVLEAVALGTILWMWQMPSHVSARYFTLATPAASYGTGPLVRVVFEPGLKLDELQLLLRGIGARIIDGPTEAGVFTLGFTNQVRTEQQLENRAAALRADPHVRFAEPLSLPHTGQPR